MKYVLTFFLFFLFEINYVPVKSCIKYELQDFDYISDTMADFKPILAKTSMFEGGYQANADDNANYNSLGQLVGTKYGISAVAYEAFYHRPPSVEDMKGITREMQEAILTKNYWNLIRGSEIKNQDIADIIFGMFVGKPAQSNKIVKESLADFGYNLNVSNPYSDSVVNAINKTNHAKLFAAIQERSIAYAQTLSTSIRAGWTKKMTSYDFGGSKKKWIIISAVAIALGIGCYIAYKKGYHKRIIHYFKK
jgi:lysozyme family protein